MATEIAVKQSGQLPKVKGPEMNERDWINDVLSSVKQMTVGYTIGLNEMQNPKLHQDIQNILNDTHAMQLQLFDAMFQKGWYKMKAADQQEISQAHTQFSDYRTQFPQF
jgi:spore coat protein CotF